MKKDIILNFIYTFLISVVMFIQNKYFIQYMGIETLGIMKLFGQLLQYLNIVELGLGSASAFALYKPLVEKNQKQVSIILSTIKSIYNKISLLLFCLGIGITPFLPCFMKIENFNKDIYFYWILYIVNTVSTYLYIKYIILFTANQEFIYVRFVQSVSKIFYQILQIIFIIKYQSFLLFILLLLLDNLTQYIFFKIHYKNKYSYISETKERYLELNRDIKNLFWHKMGGLIVFNTDLILISKLISMEVVGIYASYQLIVQMIMTLIGTVANVIRPNIGKYVSINTKEDIYILFKKINIIFLEVAIFFSYVTYKLINNFISLWLKKDLEFSKITVILICINILIKIFRIVIDIFKESCGFFDDIHLPILESIINLLFSIILGIKYGLNGIIMGTVISNITIILIYKPILVFKICFNKNIIEYIKVYGNYFGLLGVSLLFLNIGTKFFIGKNVENWIEWIIYAVEISVITTGILVLIFIINKNFSGILKVKIKNEVIKK